MNNIERVRARLFDIADALIVADEKTGMYLSGFPASDSTVFITRSSAILFTDPRYIEAAAKEARGCEAKLPDVSVVADIKKIIADEGIKTIAFEDKKLSVSALARYERLFEGVSFVPAGDLIESLCEYKTEEELAAIRAAQELTDKAFAEVIPLLNYNMTEQEVAAEIEYRMKRLGAQAPSFETIAVSGTQSSRPHGVPRNVKLEKGFLTMDFGCILNGYCSDMTRTVSIGKADEEMKKVYNTVLRAQTAAIDFICDAFLGGDEKTILCSDADKVARDIIDADYAGCFGHSLGHGVGMYIHEEPRLSSRCTKPLKVGHVVTVEPGIYIPGKYGVRIEDMLQITPLGAIDITKSPKILIEI